MRLDQREDRHAHEGPDPTHEQPQYRHQEHAGGNAGEKEGGAGELPTLVGDGVGGRAGQEQEGIAAATSVEKNTTSAQRQDTMR